MMTCTWQGSRATMGAILTRPLGGGREEERRWGAAAVAEAAASALDWIALLPCPARKRRRMRIWQASSRQMGRRPRPPNRLGAPRRQRNPPMSLFRTTSLRNKRAPRRRRRFTRRRCGDRRPTDVFSVTTGPGRLKQWEGMRFALSPPYIPRPPDSTCTMTCFAPLNCASNPWARSGPWRTLRSCTRSRLCPFSTRMAWTRPSLIGRRCVGGLPPSSPPPP